MMKIHAKELIEHKLRPISITARKKYIPSLQELALGSMTREDINFLNEKGWLDHRPKSER